MAIIKKAHGALIQIDIPANEALASPEITERFIKLAQHIKKLAPRSDEFLYFTAIMLHSSEASLIDLKTGDPKKDKDGKVITGGFDDKWKWSCSEKGITPYFNQNMDTFPEIELKKAYKNWIGRPLCVNHQSSDVEGVRGIIIDTHYDEKFKRVVGLIALDKKSYPELAHKVRSGYANSTSMGTAVSQAICAECGNAAITEADYCNCMRAKRGEINIGLSPIELSLVVTPADQHAKVIKILASLNNYTDQRNLLLESKERVENDKLAVLDTSVKTIETQLNRLFSECSDNACQFVRGKDGHINLIKVAQDVVVKTPESNMTWQDFFALSKSVDSASDYDKKDLFDQMTALRKKLDIKDLANNSDLLLQFVDSMASKNKYLHESYLQPMLEELKATEEAPQQPQSMQEHQFTSPSGFDGDLGLDSGSEVSTLGNPNETGNRLNKVVNPQPAEIKPDSGSNVGPLLGTASDKMDIGNYASMLMAKGGLKITANVDKNLTLLLQQTQDIEKEMIKLKDGLNIEQQNTTTADFISAATEDKMNEARLKLRSAQRRALLEKQANENCAKCADDGACKECEKCDEHCKCDAKEKKAYWLGTTEPTPGKPQYKPDNGGVDKIRMNDKQMHQDKSMGGADSSFPGDEAEKKKHSRAELEARALQRRAYWLGTTEPTLGKPQYKVDPLSMKARNDLDKQMHQDKSMGGADGSFPGDEAEKKKHLRAELVPGVLRTKFTKVRNADGSYNKLASYFEIFAGENKLLKATAEEIYGDELEKTIDGAEGKTGWDLLSSTDYGKEVMATIRSDGFDKVAYLLKGAQAMPEMPPALDMPAPAMDANMGAPKDAPADKDPAQKTEVDVNELMTLVGSMEDALDRMRTVVTGEDKSEVEGVEVESPDHSQAAEKAGEELTASIRMVGREVYSNLDRSADELALLVDFFSKSASLSSNKKDELSKIAAEAIDEGKSLLDEAETIIAVAGKMPPGLIAFQKKKKEEGKGKKDKDAKDGDKDKKDKKDKKDDKKDKKEKDKKKSKKAALAEALMKLASELDAESDEDVTQDAEPAIVTAEMDDLEKEMKELGLSVDAADDMKDKACGMCGMAMDKEHSCTANAKDILVREALETRRAKRASWLKAAEEKKYDVTADSDMVGEAHPSGGTTTKLDVKPAGDGAKVEDLDEVHAKMMDAATAAPTGKQGSAEVNVKEAADAKVAEVKAALETEVRIKKADEDRSKHRIKLRRAYDLALMMQEKGLIHRTKEALDKQVDDVLVFDDAAFEAFKRAVSNTQGTIKNASRAMPQVGVREDNSQPGDNSVESGTLESQLNKLW